MSICAKRPVSPTADASPAKKQHASLDDAFVVVSERTVLDWLDNVEIRWTTFVYKTSMETLARANRAYFTPLLRQAQEGTRPCTPLVIQLTNDMFLDADEMKMCLRSVCRVPKNGMTDCSGQRWGLFDTASGTRRLPLERLLRHYDSIGFFGRTRQYASNDLCTRLKEENLSILELMQVGLRCGNKPVRELACCRFWNTSPLERAHMVAFMSFELRGAVLADTPNSYIEVAEDDDEDD